MPRKSDKNPKEPVREDLEQSPELKRARPNLLGDNSSHEDSSSDDGDEFLHTHHAPTKISQDDPLLPSQIQHQADMSDGEWEERNILKMTVGSLTKWSLDSDQVIEHF